MFKYFSVEFIETMFLSALLVLVCTGIAFNIIPVPDVSHIGKGLLHCLGYGDNSIGILANLFSK